MSDKKDDYSKELVRLDFSFDKGINFADRIIQITGEIEDNSSFDWLDAALCEMERGSKKGITIRICSIGGSVYEALAMIGRLKASKCHITTEGYGCIMSAASILLAAGDKRKMSSYAQFMWHESSYAVGGRHSEIKDAVEQSEREERLWAKWMSELSDKDASFWFNHGVRKDFYMSAEECLATGVIDEIF